MKWNFWRTNVGDEYNAPYTHTTTKNVDRNPRKNIIIMSVEIFKIPSDVE